MESPNKFALYIGKGATVIHESMLEANYAGVVAENLYAAQHTLIRFSKVHQLFPDVIICDYKINLDELKSFLDFIRNHIVFRTIPFLLLIGESGQTGFDGSSLSELAGIDDLFYYNSRIQDLHHKIEFIKKFKLLSISNPISGQSEVRLESPRRPFAYFTKRIFDILISSIILLLLSPVFLVIALAIKLDSRGRVFYTSLRAGTGYKVFSFFKFRTMVEGADKRLEDLTHLNQYHFGSPQDGSPLFVKVKDDPRITRVGSFLRNTSLDELPQLINVLKGDMSLVGNRPLPLYEAATLTRDEWAERFLAPAGITGLWQVRKRGRQEMSAEERINLDITYAHKNSFLYDIRIMMNTPLALIQKENV